MSGSTFRKYIKGSFEELTKVVWPTKNQAVRLTIIVMVFCVVCALIFGAFDLIFNRFFMYLLNLTP